MYLVTFSGHPAWEHVIQVAETYKDVRHMRRNAVFAFMRVATGKVSNHGLENSKTAKRKICSF